MTGNPSEHPAGAAPAGEAWLIPLRVLEAELHHPGVACSPARLEQLLHPEFFEVGRSGARYTRAQVVRYLAFLSSPEAPPRPVVQASGHAVVALGPDCALLTYESVQSGGAGEPVLAARRSSVWKWDGQGWKLFYHQGTPCTLPD